MMHNSTGRHTNNPPGVYHVSLLDDEGLPMIVLSSHRSRLYHGLIPRPRQGPGPLPPLLPLFLVLHTNKLTAIVPIRIGNGIFYRSKDRVGTCPSPKPLTSPLSADVARVKTAPVQLPNIN